MTTITETNIETLGIEVLQSLGRHYLYGLSIAPGYEYVKRECFEQIILAQHFGKAVGRLNPDIPSDAQERPVQKVLRIYSPYKQNIYETHTLTRLRDKLLPKLMSVEIRVAKDKVIEVV